MSQWCVHGALSAPASKLVSRERQRVYYPLVHLIAAGIFAYSRDSQLPVDLACYLSYGIGIGRGPTVGADQLRRSPIGGRFQCSAADSDPFIDAAIQRASRRMSASWSSS
jgi:hypothetical protein